MVDQSNPPGQPRPDDFLQQAEKARPSQVGEFWAFLRYTRKWWLTPLIILLLLLGLFLILGGTAAAPFIYTLF